MVKKEPNLHLASLFSKPPFVLATAEKHPLFCQALQEEMLFHYANCQPFQRFCQHRDLDFSQPLQRLDDFPYLPIQAFKHLARQLLSVEPEAVKVKLQSSGTSGIPSTVMIDRLTSRRQTKAMSMVISDLIGRKRRPFLFMDVDPRSHIQHLKARGAAILGFLNYAAKASYCLEPDSTGNLQFNADVFTTALADCNNSPDGPPPVIFAFTYVLFQEVLEPLYQTGQTFPMPAESVIVHIGGWKKLTAKKITPNRFKEMCQAVFAVEPARVIDIYGFTEQMGLNYPDCPAGVKHLPAFAELLVRNPNTMDLVHDGEVGILQFLTPIPHSYPGNSVLTDDMGRILGRDDCRCGRMGGTFEITGRVAKAEIRGCGDVMTEKTVAIQPLPFSQTETTADIELLLHNGQHGGVVKEIGPLIGELEQKQQWLAAVPVEALIVILDALSQRWRASELYADLDKRGLAFLCDWCSADNLRRLTDSSLRDNRGYLDEFLPFDGSGKRKLMALPRGLTMHWVAGNVPLIGLFVLVQGIISKNINIIKAPAAERHLIGELLSQLNSLEITLPMGYHLQGSELLKTILVLYFPRDHQAGRDISAAADVRVAWGGREAVESVSAFPKKYAAQDVMFGPKLSFMVIGREWLQEGAKLKKLLRRAATDCSVFDQYACSSPHSIFIESGGAISPKEFAKRLATQMEKTLHRIPKTEPDPGKVMEILLQRIRYDMLHDLWHSKDTGWTVLYDEKQELAQPCYSRVVTVRPLPDIMQGAQYANPDIQSIGLALTGERRLDFASECARRGVLRLPDIGHMTLFDTVWDGLMPMERMVRWVTLGGP